MKIPIPHWLDTTWDAFGDWANVPIAPIGRVELRRLDIILVALSFVVIGYYYYVGGWMGALQGGALYIAMLLAAMCIL